MEKLFGGFFVVWIALLIAGLIAGAVGWVMNIVTIVKMVSDPVTGMFILRCVGIFFFPLGAVLGYF